MQKRQTPIIEIVFVLITATGKFIFMDWLNWKFPFIVVAILMWSGYVLWRVKREPIALNKWGFRWDNFWLVIKRMLPFGLLSVVASIATGYWLGTINITWHIIPILLVYPIWGTIQQFLVISLVAVIFRI